jgi:phosphopantothenoylcysteine decarboxylase
MDSERLLVIATGSSAASILTAYLAELKAALDLRIDVLMTTAAERFIRAEVVGWYADRVMTCDTHGLNPIEAALTARAICVLPASANTLASAALGLMATPATTALAAAPSPTLYFPHMNGAVWGKPFVQQHIATLRERGDTVVAPIEREVFHIWNGGKAVAPAMPGPADAAEVVKNWLSAREAATSGDGGAEATATDCPVSAARRAA